MSPLKKVRVTANDTNARAVPGVLRRIIIEAPGTVGSFDVFDATLDGEEVAGNRIWTAAFNSAGITVGATLEFITPVDRGIRIATVTTGGIILVVSSDS